MTQTTATDEAYGADGTLLWRYTGSSADPNQRAFVPFEGGILAEYYGGSPGGTLFDHPDELGSLTASTSYNGGACQERLFYPFGELWTGAGNCGMHQTFGKLPDYDAETDQYNTLNRHYSPSGRWLSPDPGGVNTYSWDSDANSINIAGVGLTFDALDRMVEQNRSGSYTQIVYGPQGNKLALMDRQDARRFRLGGRARFSEGPDRRRRAHWRAR